MRIRMLAAFLLAVLLPHAAYAAEAPRIALDAVPAYGSADPIRGHVWGTSSASRYRVTAFLRVPGDDAWWVKPHWDRPTVALDGDLRFTLPYATGGIDERATEIRVFLVPAAYAPAGIADTRAHALDEVVVRRTPSGDVAIDQRAEPAATATPGAIQGATGGKILMTFSPYVGGLSPERNDRISAELLRELVSDIAPYASGVRTYGTSGEMGKLYPILKEKGMTVYAGCWLASGYGASRIQEELDSLIDLANAGYVDVAIVGNETLHRGDVTAAQLIGYIRYVRAGIRDASIPVATADTLSAWTENPALVRACDMLLLNAHPYWSGTSADAALDDLQGAYDRARQVAEGRRVVIAETGMPTAGATVGAWTPSMESAARYVEDVSAWARRAGVVVFLHEAFDSAWKDGVAERNWGFFERKGAGYALKPGYAGVLGRMR